MLDFVLSDGTLVKLDILQVLMRESRAKIGSCLDSFVTKPQTLLHKNFFCLPHQNVEVKRGEK